MNIEFRKKYEIITSVIENCGEVAFTIGDLYAVCENIGKKYGISLNIKDVLYVLSNLYDGFEIRKEVTPDGTVSFRKTLVYGTYEDYVSAR